MRRDLLVRGGRVIDGSGRGAFAADVLVRGGRIVEVGPSLRGDGEPVLDAGGAVVAPGFIDSHTHFDASLYWDPHCDPMPEHGVTTVVIGNCSLSLAPIAADARREASETFAFIEDIPLAAFERSLPWDWESYPEYVDAMNRLDFGVNVVGLVGHSMLRLSAVGDAAWDRASTDDERAELAGAMDAAMAAGARGVSVSFFDRGADGRPVPSSLADDAELRAIVEVVGRHGGHVELIPAAVAMQRDEALGQLERIAGWCGASGASMSWNGFLDLDGDPTLSIEFLDLAHRLQAAGVRAYPQMSPRPIELTVDFEQTMSFMYLPAWNDFVQADDSAKAALAGEETWRARAAAEWDAQTQEFFPHRHLDRVRITTVSDVQLDEWRGKSLGDWARARGGHPSDALAEWVTANAFRPGLNYTVGNADPERVGALCADPGTLVSASDAGAHLRMFCASGDTTLLLTRHVRERGDLTLEAAIHELTARQADVLGLTGRGTIAPGSHADLVVFAPDELHWDDEESVADVPPDGTPRFRRPSGGYRATVLGGVVTQESGVATDALPGSWLAC